jgi:hypothetical protein
MKGLRRALTVAFPLIISLVLMSRVALADGITTFAASDDAEMDGISPDTILPDCFDEEGALDTEGPINYRQFTDVYSVTR